MNDRHSKVTLFIDGMGKCHAADGAEALCGNTDLLSAMGVAIATHASKLSLLCELGELHSIELHTQAGPPVQIEPSSEEGLTLRF